jgi:hypothetical protein
MAFSQAVSWGSSWFGARPHGLEDGGSKTAEAWPGALSK